MLPLQGRQFGRIAVAVARLQEMFEPRNTIYSLLMICPIDPLQKNLQNPEKIQAKAIQGHAPWLQITSEPFCSDPCARHKIQIPKHSISWGCPKIVCHCDPI